MPERVCQPPKRRTISRQRFQAKIAVATVQRGGIAMARLELGQVVATPAALEKIEEAGQGVGEFLDRHAAGDWGDLGADDKATNEAALQDGSRLFSKYHTRLGEPLWIITEAIGDDGSRMHVDARLPSSP